MDELFNPGPFRSVATYHKANLASNWASSGRIYTQLNSANKLTIIRSRNHLTKAKHSQSFTLTARVSSHPFLEKAILMRSARGVAPYPCASVKG